MLLAVAALAAAASAGPVGGRLALVLLLAAAGLPAGAWLAGARVRAIDRTTLRPWIGHAADVRAVVLAPPRPRSFGRSAAPVRITAGPGRGERVLLVAEGALPGVVGRELRVRGGFRPLPAFEQAARRAGAHALLAADNAAPTGARRGGLLGAVDRVRERAERALDRGLPPALAGLARGMVLGEDDRLTRQMTDDFRASGLAHLVAASGANVALLAALVLALGALAGIPRRPRLLLALVLVAGYVPLAGGGPSIQRAGIMGAATLVAALASRAASRWYALLLAGGRHARAQPAGGPGPRLAAELRRGAGAAAARPAAAGDAAPPAARRGRRGRRGGARGRGGDRAADRAALRAAVLGHGAGEPARRRRPSRR